VLGLKVRWIKSLDIFLYGKHNAPVCTSRFLPFPLIKNVRFSLFTGWVNEVTHDDTCRVEHLHFTSFLTLFENFISCSRNIWFCVLLEQGKPYLRWYVPASLLSIHFKTGSFLPHRRCNLFVLQYWCWCHSKR